MQIANDAMMQIVGGERARGWHASAFSYRFLESAAKSCLGMDKESVAVVDAKANAERQAVAAVFQQPLKYANSAERYKKN